MTDDPGVAEGQEGSRDPAAPLPEAVRQRVVTLAADCLGQMPAAQLPASLKRVAAFASARRARLAGNQIAAVLEADPVFRGRLAVHVRAREAEIAAALDDGTPPRVADPADVAAVAYLLRSDGWSDLVGRAEDAGEELRARVVEREADERLGRLRHQLAEAHAEVRSARERHRQQVSELKAENTELRRKLGEVRSRVGAAEADTAAERERAAEAAAAAETGASTAEAELRRLRSRVAELEKEVAAGRRAERNERDQGTLRARLLLDTVIEATHGLRRELALPPVTGAPADTVAADVAEHGARPSSGHGSLALDDPRLLAELLELPGVHLVVDGYNVTKTAWPGASLEIQRDRLLGGLAALAARARAEVTVVFDAADKAERPLVKPPRGVRVLYSPFGVIADDVIRDLVAAEPPGRPLVVVTSDQAVVGDVQRAGARAVAARALSRLLART